MANIAIIGAGAWGTGLAIVLGRRPGHKVCLWAYEPEVARSVSERHVNEIFLNGQAIPASVSATSDLATALAGADIVVSVMPSHHCRAIFQKITASRKLKPDAIIFTATKVIEEGSMLRMTEIIATVLGEKGSYQRIA